jgi:uncharacterized protein (TIGR03085 family)
MSATSTERHELADLFEQLGPDAPTLCAGWQTRDLLAHLLVRERRPDAAAGIAISALAGHTRTVQNRYADRPYAELIDEFRGGTPLWSVFAWPVVGDMINLFEFYVHHEDVRRAQQHWAPRPENPELEDGLHSRLRLGGRMMFKKSPVGVVLRSAGKEDIVAHKGDRSVVLVGLPSEIAMIAAGRPTDTARVVIQGEADDVAAFTASARSI